MRLIWNIETVIVFENKNIKFKSQYLSVLNQFFEERVWKAKCKINRGKKTFNPLNAKGVYIRLSVVISVTTNVFHKQPLPYIIRPGVVIWNATKISSQQPKA